jgi:two-component system NarL family sensor kinase
MYDPMVVDTFFKFHLTVSSEIPRQGPPSEVLNTIARSRQAAPASDRSATPDEITSSADEMLTVHDLARALAGQVSLSDAGDVIAKHLRRLIPSSLCVLYFYDRATDELEAKHAVGEGGAQVRGLRIALGQRLSGWVAANRQTISNSDARLDLSGAVASQPSKLRSCLSAPLLSDGELVGVLTLYSAEVNGFNEDHKRIIEAIARQIAHPLQGAAEFDGMSRRNALTGPQSSTA